MIKEKINKIIERFYIRKLRKKNKNMNPTIISNNCIAGVIYHNLGLKFYSPTINLMIAGKDYLEFVKNIEYYTKCDLIDETEIHKKGYPVGKLIGDSKHIDITINFMHYGTFEIAKEKWMDRCKRINWTNIFFIWEFYDSLYDTKLIEEFDQLKIKKICILHREFVNIKNKVLVNCYKNDNPPGKILQYKFITGKRYLELFDYVKFIN